MLNWNSFYGKNFLINLLFKESDACSNCKEKDSELIPCDECEITQCHKCTNLAASEVRAFALKK